MNSIWHQNPFLRIALAFVLGLLMAYFVGSTDQVEWWVIGSFATLFFGVWLARARWRSFRHRHTFGVLISVVFMLLGFIRYSQYGRHNQLQEIPQQTLIWSGAVEEYPIQTERSIKLELKLFGYFSEGERHVIESNVLAYAKQNSGLDTLIIGDKVVFEGAISQFDIPVNPGQFDYGAYLKNHGVNGMVFLNSNRITVSRPESHSFNIVHLFKKVQNQMVAIFARYDMPQRELGVASALVLGYRSNIDSNVKQEYADAGVVHILAVSGLHVGIIYLIFEWLLSLLFRNKKWSKLKLVILLLLLWSYAGITGLSPSVLRATTMFSFLAAGKQFQRYGSIYNMLAVSAVVLLLYNPMLLFEVGFQLSYLAVIGIAVFFKPIHNLWIIENKILDKIWSLGVVSLAAQISTFPLAIYYFNQFPSYFLLSNILIITLATFCLYTGLAALAFSWIPGIDWLLLKAVYFIFFVLNFIVEWISNLPYAKVDYLFLKPITVVCFYLFIGFSFKFFESPKRWKVWWPLAFMAILTGLYATRKASVYNTFEVAVIQGSEQPITLIQHGRVAWVKIAKSPEIFLKKEQFYLTGYRNLKGISHLNILSENDTLVLGDVTWIGDTLKVRVSDNQISEYNNNNKLIWVSDEIEIDSTANALYLINPAISEYKKSAVKTALQNAKESTWDMESQGIFLLQLD